MRRLGHHLPSVALVAALLLLPRPGHTNGGDLPPQILLEGFVKPEGDHLHLVVRIPLILLQNLNLPKRGPGYLDLVRIDKWLNEAAAATGRDIELFEDHDRLVPTRSAAQISLPSDRSFDGYASAAVHIAGRRLPVSTDVFWNQGYFDAHLEYPIRSVPADFAIHMKVEPGLGQRIKLRVQYLPVSGVSRTYEIRGGSGRLSLDPRWYEAARMFVMLGFGSVFATDRLVFLLCLVAPFRQVWGLLAVVMALTGSQAMTLIASAVGTAHEVRWLPALFDTCVGAAVVLLAVDNVVAPSLHRRWFTGALVGVIGGFGLGRLFVDERQFAGAHTLVSLASFNVGVALGEAVALLLAFVALGVLFTRVLGASLGVVVLSAVLGHMGWHWMIDGVHRLGHTLSTGLSASAVASVGWWLLMGLLVGGAAWFLPTPFGGASIPPLLPGRPRGDRRDSD